MNKLENEIPINYQVETALGTIVSVSLGNNRTSVTWEKSYQFYLGTIVPTLLGNSCNSEAFWIIKPVLLENNHVSATKE